MVTPYTELDGMLAVVWRSGFELAGFLVYAGNYREWRPTTGEKSSIIADLQAKSAYQSRIIP
jgi:hypothetical protein